MRGLMALVVAAFFLLAAASVAVLWYGTEVDFTYGRESEGGNLEKKAEGGRPKKQKMPTGENKDPEKSAGDEEASKPGKKAVAEQPENEDGEEEERGPERKMFDVRLPAGLKGVEFGLPAEKIAAAYDPAWRKVKRGKDMFAHYPGDDRSRYYLFEFDNEGLDALEVRYKAEKIQHLDELYQKIMRSTTMRFGGSPDTARRRWRGEELEAKLQKGGNYVAVRFIPRQ